MVRGRLMRIGEQGGQRRQLPGRRARPASDRARIQPVLAQPICRRAIRSARGDWFSDPEMRAGARLGRGRTGRGRWAVKARRRACVFMIGGQETRVRVSSLRKLDWDSMRVNFFVLTPPGVLDGAGQLHHQFPAHVARRDGRARLGRLRRHPGHRRRLHRPSQLRHGADRAAAGSAGLPRRHHQPAGLAFRRALPRAGRPNLFFGVTAGNMDSMVNRYTADRKIRSDDAYTPNAEPGTSAPTAR
jgi:hypothetical protein